jgi:DNA-binding transcriptional ArsR family regulator
MTAPKHKSERQAALDRLSEVVEQRLVDNAPDGLTLLEVTEGTGFAACTVRVRLEALEEMGIVHRVRHIMPGRPNHYFLWHIGAKPAAAYVEKHTPNAKPGSVPRQPTLRVYPPVNRRDELVAALFGPAGKEAA